MTPTNANRRIVKFLRELADEGKVEVETHKHPKVIGVFGGQKRTFSLSSTPSSNYQRSIRCRLNRFVRSLPIEIKPHFSF